MTQDQHPIFEIPDGTVKRQATFYCRMGDVLDGYLSFEELGKSAYFPPANDVKWRPETSRHFEQVPMPEDAGPLWSHWRLKADETTMAPFCSRLRMTTELPSEHVPDINSWPPFVLVSARAREVLERIDPAGSLFIEAHVETRSGESLPERRFHWILRNRIFFTSYGAKERLPGASLPFPGMFSNPQLAWQLIHNPAVRMHLSALPFWGRGMAMITYAFNAPAFAEMRAARLTGLVENTANFPGDRNYYESIGHIS